jgi:ACT domain-containing protein
MIPAGVRGNKKDCFQVRMTKMKFRELLAQFKSNKEIMQELGLKRRTFYRYKSIIMEEDRILWRKMMNGE